MSTQFDLKKLKKVKCALLQTSCLHQNQVAQPNLHLVMTPPDDGWNKMFSKSPQNGLNGITLEQAVFPVK